MIEFNYARARVLSHVRREGNEAVISLLTHTRTFRMPRENVQVVVTPHLDDMSLRVVDFGAIDDLTKATEAVIGVGSAQKQGEMQRMLDA